MTYTLWTERETELFKQAWNSNAYSREDLVRIFGRSWESIDQKARRINLPLRTHIEEQARIDAIEKALKKDHVI